jgi:hypothetical protein
MGGLVRPKTPTQAAVHNRVSVATVSPIQEASRREAYGRVASGACPHRLRDWAS